MCGSCHLLWSGWLSSSSTTVPNTNSVLVYNLNLCCLIIFIVLYGVMGTLSHSKIIFELLLQNDISSSFFWGVRSPLNPHPPEGETPSTLPDAEGEELIRKGKEYFLTRKVNPSEMKFKFNLKSFFSQDYVIWQNQVSYSFKYNLYRKMFFKLL